MKQELCPLFVPGQGTKPAETRRKLNAGIADSITWFTLVSLGVRAGIALITQRSVVQIHPPQPNNQQLTGAHLGRRFILSPFCPLFFFTLLLLAPLAIAQTTLPLTERDGLLRVTILLNDAPRMFLLDTGARTTIITPKASGLTKVGLSKLLTVHLSGLGGSGTDIPVAPIQLRIGGKELIIDVGIAELPTLKECDGILGSDVLRQFGKIVIDYKAHTLTLYQ